MVPVVFAGAKIGVISYFANIFWKKVFVFCFSMFGESEVLVY